METGKREGRLTSALLAEDYLHAGENGKFNANRFISMYRRLRDPVRLAPDHAADRSSIQGH